MSSGNRSKLDDADLSSREVLERESKNVLRLFTRSTTDLFASGIAAGFILSFGVLFIGMVLMLANGFRSDLSARLALGISSSVAFLLVIISQTKLFTIHTTLAILPIFDKRKSLDDLSRVWGLVYVSNLVGCVIFVSLILVIESKLSIVNMAAIDSFTNTLLPFPWWTILLSGIVTGWLLGLATWFSVASQDIVGRLLLVLVTTAMIGFGPFHHCILDTTTILLTMFLGEGVTIGSFIQFLIPTTIGNIIGNGAFIGFLKYGYVGLADNR